MAIDGPTGRTNPRLPLRLAPPALTPAARRERLPSPSAMRRRYKLAPRASVPVGGLVAAVVILGIMLGSVVSRAITGWVWSDQVQRKSGNGCRHRLLCTLASSCASGTFTFYG